VSAEKVGAVIILMSSLMDRDWPHATGETVAPSRWLATTRPAVGRVDIGLIIPWSSVRRPATWLLLLLPSKCLRVRAVGWNTFGRASRSWRCSVSLDC
jgi:hypothetical protein